MKTILAADAARVGPTGKVPGVRYDPNWKRRTAANWKIPYLAARGVNVPVRADKRDLQAAKRMAMKECRKGGAAAVRKVVILEA